MPATTQLNTPSKKHTDAIVASSQLQSEIEEIDAAIGRLSRQMNAFNYELMIMIREFDERGGWLKWGFTDAVSWLRWRCDLSANAARDKLRVAHALKKLPVMSKAFEHGELSYSKVRSLTRIATSENEAGLIEQAAVLSASNVEALCRQRLNTKKAATDSANRSHAKRSLRLWQSENTGMMTVAIDLTIDEGKLFEKAIEKAAGLLAAETLNAPDALQHEDGSWHSLQADAAMLVVREYLMGARKATADTDARQGGSSADLYQVVVHVDEKALVAGCDDNAESQASSQLPIETVRRLCCDGSIVPIVENAKGEPLNVGRKVRTITTAIRRALWSRDKGCAYPGCQSRRYVDAHHIKHWADGGETCVDNLVLLCSQHHRLVHEGGYSIEIDHMQQRFFRRPDGRAVPVCGYRLDDWLDEDIGDIVSHRVGINSVRENSCEFYVVA